MFLGIGIDANLHITSCIMRVYSNATKHPFTCRVISYLHVDIMLEKSDTT